MFIEAFFVIVKNCLVVIYIIYILTPSQQSSSYVWPKRNKHSYSHTDVYMNIYRSTVHHLSEKNDPNILQEVMDKQTGTSKQWNAHFSSVQSFRLVRLFVTPWTAALQASLFITNSQSLLKLMSIESVMYPTILSSVVPFSSCLQSFPASESFPVSQFFVSGGRSIGVSASTLVLSMNIQDCSTLG